MQLKLSLLSLTSLTIIFGALQLVANQSSLASQLAQDYLESSTTTNSSQLASCTSTDTSKTNCTLINTEQSVPSSSNRPDLGAVENEQLAFSWGDRTESSSTNKEKSADVGTQNQGIDKSDRAWGEGSSTKTDPSTDSTSSFDEQSNQPNSEGGQPNSLSNPESNSSSKSEVSISAVEQEVHKQINQYRAEKGLNALTLDNTINEQARKHSQNMASGAVGFSHDGFPTRVGAIANTIPYQGSAENVAYNQGYEDPATKAVQGWLNSSGHLKNIQGNYNLTGIGVVKNAEGEYYFTQLFIRSR